MNSIRRRLLVWLLGGVLLGTLAAGLAVYVKALNEANALFDAQLRQLAVAFPLHMAAAPDFRVGQVLADGLVVQVWDRSGAHIYTSQPQPLPPRVDGRGMRILSVQGERWQTFTAQHADRFVQVAQPTEVRREQAAAMAVRTVLPLVLLLPLLGVLIWVVVGRGLRPLGQLAEALGRRAPESTDTLEVDAASAELRPVVDAVNALLGRLHRTLESQQALIADAAHELRTPLTALKLQMQLAERSVGADRHLAYRKVHERLERADRLVGQLLTLARLEPGTPVRADLPLDLGQLTRSVVADFMTLAQDRGVALSLAADPGVQVPGDAEALSTLLNNLVDNALHYTPSGGRVRVTCAAEAAGPVVRVADTGPGIPVEDRARVFDRFYRRLGGAKSGSGLGLAIVKRIAQDHGVEVTLSDPPAGSGLVVTVRFSVG